MHFKLQQQSGHFMENDDWLKWMSFDPVEFAMKWQEMTQGIKLVIAHDRL